MPKDLPTEEKEIPEEVTPLETLPVPEKKQSPLFNFLIQFALVAILFFAIGFSFGKKNFTVDQKGLIPTVTVTNQTAPQNINVDFSLFWKVYETLPQKYLEKNDINGEKILYGAISGMVRSLGDPYTAFLDPKQNENIRSEIAGSFEGVGIQIGFDKEKRLAVIAPLKGTPAERAGVQAKDLILKIDDKEAFDLTLPEAVDLIRGAAGTKVKIQFLREGQDGSFDREIVREKIDVKTVTVEFKQQGNDDVAVISVSRFGEKTDTEWDAVVDEVIARNVDAIIVDMRNNPGGLLSSSVHLASEFMRGTVVKQEFANGSISSIASDHNPKIAKTTLVVLVNEGSASAAEIFAGAMQDGRRAKIVGEKTFGKGTVQDVVDLPGGSGLHVTIARWLTPKGNSIHHVGITPDEAVEMSQEDRDNDRDPQLEKALELI